MAPDTQAAPGDAVDADRIYDAWQAALRAQPANWAAMLDAAAAFWSRQVGLAAPEGRSDRRFAAPEWTELPPFDQVRRAYLAASDTLLQAVEAAPLDERSRRQMRFLARQFVDAMSPANFVTTNPEVLRLALETGGRSLADGARNLLADVQRGRISQSADAFRVGVDLANTPGDVVFENELIQLIQYRPTRARVKAVPLLVVPSVVNKYYILDLAPETSLVRHLIDAGQTVFMISWRNISAPQQHLTWDDYLEQGVQVAIDTVREITRRPRIQAAGYCTGGALLATALAVRAARGERPVNSMTLLMTMLDFSDPGEIGVFLDPAVLSQHHARYAAGGVVPGREMTLAFSSLRANDLVWSFVVGNYLKGRTPAAFDLLYWNTDDANLAGPMFSTYLRDGYVDNKLVVPDALTMCGVPVDLRRIDVPTYVFAASEDHLVPWQSAFRSVHHLDGEVEFVLGAGGHVTGPINPVSRNKRNHWVGGRLDSDADAWRASARSVEGSWWHHWSGWLERRAGAEVAPPRRSGSRTHKPIEPAPGRYVLERLR
jgi:polyhydroxyalkanoate synthase subunit PhaC